MIEKKFEVNVVRSAFDRQQQRTTLSDKVKSFDKTVLDMNEAVEELDRYDDFSMLRINPSTYKKIGDAEYGIPIVVGQNDGVIYEKQRSAALNFLKELRGFGLLADVVGSGKTFEACVILSELAVRGMVKSLLLVVPSHLIDNWNLVLGKYFGLGTDSIMTLGKDFDISKMGCEYVEEGDYYSPKKPMMVTMEDFVKWPDDAKKVLFDVIIVDEAHHLCVEKGEQANAMRLLSLMMQTKKRADKTYCLLLSATPHSGNLEDMFRLWYFIRCKGGNPSDFEVKEDKLRTAEYQSEKKYYKDHVCRGASTVMEFIKKVKMSEVIVNHKAEFEEYLAKLGLTYDDFTQKREGEKGHIVDEFVEAESTLPETRESIEREVAGAYHNGVLRSIMIRQPNDALTKKKYAVNYLFFPMEKEPGVIKASGLDNRGKIEIDCRNLDGDTAVNADGEKMSLAEYVEDNRGYKPFAQANSELIVDKIVNNIGADYPIFSKPDSGKYYSEQWRELPEEVTAHLVPHKYVAGDNFSHKMAKAIELLKKHSQERVLVFFDYGTKGSDIVVDRFESELRKIPELSARILLGTDQKKRVIEREFREKEDTILIVKDSAFTEGINLQASNIIINFQVTPDPMAMDQCIGRAFRLGQDNDVTIYSLANMNELEGYVLMYFSRIGLMSSNSGDATIIAGSNNDRMVTIRCPVCGRVELISKEDYDIRKENDDLYCTAVLDRCVDSSRPQGTPMEEISVYDFQCDKCKLVFARASGEEEGYMCVASNNSEKGRMCCSGDKGDRKVYCRKICAVAHCKKFLSGNMAGKCRALREYEKNKNISDLDLILLCETCPHKAECTAQGCVIDLGAKAIKKCTTCREAECNTKPYVINFNEKWEAKCPVCGKSSRGGKLRPVYARTFDAFIRSAWKYEQDGGRAFCDNLTKEAKKVADIKRVLDRDKN